MRVLQSRDVPLSLQKENGSDVLKDIFSGHRNVITEGRLEDSGLWSPGLVLQSQQQRGDARAGIHPKRGTST